MIVFVQATHRTSTYETDRIIDGQRDAIYNVRRKVLEDGQQPLRARLLRYIEWIVDDACDRAKVDGLRPIDDWDIEGLLDDLRTVFAGRRDQWLNESGQTMSEFPHFLPGVDARGIRDALKSKGAMPLQTELPGLEAAPEVVAAALRGVDVVDMNPPAKPARVVDTEPEAAEECIAARVEKRMEITKGMKSLEDYGRRGMNAAEGRMLRTYLSESAIALYLDRFARLNQRYDRTDLEAVERVWVLRAIDDRWQRHLVEMQVLRSSVNVRAFGQLDPMEEYRIDGARAFVDMVRDMRRKTVANVFFFVGSAVEPTLDFEEVAAEEAAAVANPAAAEREAEIAKVMQATGMTAMADFISEGDDAEAETVLVEAQRRAARAGKKPRAMDEGEQKKMMEEAERVLAKQRALIEEEEEEDLDDDSDGSVTYKF